MTFIVFAVLSLVQYPNNVSPRNLPSTNSQDSHCCNSGMSFFVNMQDISVTRIPITIS